MTGVVVAVAAAELSKRARSAAAWPWQSWRGIVSCWSPEN